MKSKKDDVVLFEITSRLFWLLSVIILVGLLIYWCVLAIMKYSNEPIATSVEFRYGDDGLGNITMPMMTFCKKSLYQKSIWKNCTYVDGPPFMTAINCIEEHGDVDKFVEAIKYENPLKGTLLKPVK